MVDDRRLEADELKSLERGCRVRDDNGKELAVALGTELDDQGRVVLQRVNRGKSDLLQYYFGQSRRLVTLECADFTLKGTLATRWSNGERTWIVKATAESPTGSGPTSNVREGQATKAQESRGPGVRA
jgi:hypothetical protein